MRTIFSIDIGASILKGVYLKRDGSKYKILKLSSVERLPDLSQSVRMLIEEIPTENVCVCIPLEEIIFRPVDFPFHDKTKIRESIKFKVDQLIGIPPEQFVVDFLTIPISPQNVKVISLVLPKVKLKQYLDIFKDLGIDPVSVGVDILSMAEMLRYSEKDRCSFAVIDIGVSSSKIVIVDNNQIKFIRSIRQGGHWFTSLISSRLNIDIQEAEKIKCFSSSQQEVREIIFDGLKHLARQLHRTILSIKMDNPIEKIYLTGGGSKLPEIDIILKEELHTEIIILKSIFDEKFISEDGEKIEIPGEYLVALSQGITVMEEKINIELRQEEFAYKGIFSRIFSYLLILFCCFFLMIGIKIYQNMNLLAYYKDYIKKLKKERENVYLKLYPDKKKPPISLLTLLKSKLRQIDISLSLEQMKKRNFVFALDIFKELAKRIPSNITFIINSINISQTNVKLNGYTTNFATVEKVITKLNQYSRFNASIIDMKKKGDKVHFSIEIELK